MISMAILRDFSQLLLKHGASLEDIMGIMGMTYTQGELDPSTGKYKKYFDLTTIKRNPEKYPCGYTYKIRYKIDLSGNRIPHIVFNKIRCSMQNTASSKWVESKLKRWRSGIEAIISNLKRGFQIRRCTWKGLAHYGQKIFWSVIGYDLRVMTGVILQAMTL